MCLKVCSVFFQMITIISLLYIFPIKSAINTSNSSHFNTTFLSVLLIPKIHEIDLWIEYHQNIFLYNCWTDNCTRVESRDFDFLQQLINQCLHVFYTISWSERGLDACWRPLLNAHHSYFFRHKVLTMSIEVLIL